MIGVKEELVKSCFGHCNGVERADGPTAAPHSSWVVARLLLVLPLAWRTEYFLCRVIHTRERKCQKHERFTRSVSLSHSPSLSFFTRKHVFRGRQAGPARREVLEIAVHQNDQGNRNVGKILNSVYSRFGFHLPFGLTFVGEASLDSLRGSVA